MIEPVKIPGKGKGKERNEKCPCGSGKKFKACHGAPAPQLVEAPPSTLVRLDLACGENVREGFEGVDIRGTKAIHKVDLWKFPWPWKDDSVDELHCAHHIEHIPAREIEERDLSDASRTDFLGQDMLFAFMDECWRILKPESWMTIYCPCARNNRAFQDPTHRRFIVAETFFYFNAEQRKANQLDHYLAKCHFHVDVNSTIPIEIGQRSHEVQQEMMNSRWNTVIDWNARLKKLPLPK